MKLLTSTMKPWPRIFYIIQKLLDKLSMVWSLPQAGYFLRGHNLKSTKSFHEASNLDDETLRPYCMIWNLPQAKKNLSLKVLLPINISNANNDSMALGIWEEVQCCLERDIDKLFHIASGDWLAKGSTLGLSLIEVLEVLRTTKRSLMSLLR